jgi:hypothetical protein
MRSMDNQAPIRRIEKDKICFLMEQYGKFQADKISRYGLDLSQYISENKNCRMGTVELLIKMSVEGFSPVVCPLVF